jgi:uncharacterized protein YutE (UPF0331/DUF86 family)
LRRCIQRIQDKCPDSAEALAQDMDMQDIISINLTRAIQLCVDIGAHLIASKNVTPPDTMGQTFNVLVGLGHISEELAASLKKAVGFRNIAVDNYEAINWQIVHAIATKHLGDFKEFATEVVKNASLT